MKKLWYDRAWAEYSNWQSSNARTLKKINDLIESKILGADDDGKLSLCFNQIESVYVLEKYL